MQTMKKIVRGAAAVFAGLLVLTATPLTALAGEYGYTYNYDWWGDVQESPDFYSVCKVFTGSDLGLETNLKSPDGIFADGDKLYLCDSGNNRIIELHRSSAEKLEVVRIIDSCFLPYKMDIYD